jgi:hypothetical protein
VRPATSLVDEVPAVVPQETPTAVTAMRSLLLDSSPLSDQPSQDPPEAVAPLSKQTSDEPSARVDYPLAAVGSNTARAGIAVAGRVRDLGVGLGGRFARAARSVGKAF